MQLTEAEILQVLHAIETGEVQLAPDDMTRPPAHQNGNVPYTTSHGWELVVFNDAGGWDYLDRITAPDGRTAEFDDFAKPISDDPFTYTMPQVYFYRPPDAVARDIYGLE
jgi:hypothetical protein